METTVKKNVKSKTRPYAKYPENVRQYKCKIEIEKGEEEIEIKEGEGTQFEGSKNVFNKIKDFPKLKN